MKSNCKVTLKSLRSKTKSELNHHTERTPENLQSLTNMAANNLSQLQHQFSAPVKNLKLGSEVVSNQFDSEKSFLHRGWFSKDGSDS